MTGILLKKLSVQYGQQPLFQGLDAHFSAKHWHSILGRSGVGKSTLLRAMAGLLDDYQGEVSSDDAQDLSKKVAWMAQDDLLLPWLTVRENVALGYHLRQEQPSDLPLRITRLLEKVGLLDYADRMPYRLSGGQRQRVALARTLLENKPIVLMDEPFSALDVMTRLRLQELFVELLQEKTVILITHDPLDALRLSQFVWFMKGSPARLSLITSLESPVPRALDDMEVLHWQNRLLSLMANGE